MNTIARIKSAKSRFSKSLRNEGRRFTSQRELIVEKLFAIDSHFNIEELFREMRRKRIPVSRATVYRTIACLEKEGLIRRINFDEAHARYEVAVGGKHHEHLVCNSCGSITEFSDDRFEEHIQSIAASHGFRMYSHSVEIFGMCGDCIKNGRDESRPMQGGTQIKERMCLK
ncbi:MAG: transcriptional repressor [Chitinispirillaceae bacterium]|nr:transcriptional repressor [Chitinispirillaceae bacterium]